MTANRVKKPSYIQLLLKDNCKPVDYIQKSGENDHTKQTQFTY